MDVTTNQSTAVVLAGGRSRRMGTNKALLLVDGQPLIGRVVDQLKGHFQAVVVSAPDDGTYGFLDCRVIPDKQPGQGPLMGICSALSAVETELAFIMACDMPKVDLSLITALFTAVNDHDCAVPWHGNGHIEPLFAVYRSTVTSDIRHMLDEGQRKVMDLFERVNTAYVDVQDASGLMNLNTENDFMKWKETRI